MVEVRAQYGFPHEGVSRWQRSSTPPLHSVSQWPRSQPSTAALALAQPDCGVDQLPREAAGQNRLAVRIDGDWQYFALHNGAPAHVLEIGGLRNLCMAWEAPPYPRNNRQIVCASTQYRDDQPLWLFHSSAVAGFPFVGRLFGDWSRTPDAAGADPDDAFREFHRSRPVDPDVAPWNNLANWHDTSEWLANRPSYELVVGAFRRPDPSALRCGAAAGAGSAAATHVVVPFTTYAPFGQNELRVAVFERKGTPQGSPMWLEMAVEEDDGHGGTPFRQLQCRSLWSHCRRS